MNDVIKWMLASVSDQATADTAIPPLLKCRDLCPVLGISGEPLLGPVDLQESFNRWLDSSDDGTQTTGICRECWAKNEGKKSNG